MTSRATRLAAAAYSTGSDALANAALNLARRVAPIGLRLRAMTLASLSKGGGAPAGFSLWTTNGQVWRFGAQAQRAISPSRT